MTDELRQEYDLKSLKVRKMGTNRKDFGDTIVKLDSDVAQVFPTLIPTLTDQNFPTFLKYKEG